VSSSSSSPAQLSPLQYRNSSPGESPSSSSPAQLLLYRTITNWKPVLLPISSCSLPH
jgi:hypothetical protein